MKPHRFIPVEPEATLDLPDGRRLQLFVCTECGLRQLDPEALPFTLAMAREFEDEWGWDARDCDDVKRAKALGLPGAL